MELKFKFGEQNAVMRTGTNRDRATRRILSQKLANACGGTQNISEIDQDSMWEYVTFLSHISALDIVWWRDATESADRIYEGYVQFAEDESDASDDLRQAKRELDDLRQKKAKTSS